MSAFHIPTISSGACNALLALAPLLGCGNEQICDGRFAETLNPDNVDHPYIVEKIDLPSSPLEATALGFDLDGDAQGRPNNALGLVLSALNNSADYDLDAEVNAMIASGQLLQVINIETVSTRSARGVGARVLSVFDTDSDPLDNFSGAESFGVDESRPMGLITGRIEQGRILTDLGNAPIGITFPGLGEPFILQLESVRLEATLRTDGTLSGKIGGVITQAEFTAALIPALVEGLSRIIDRDCDVQNCIPGSFGQDLLGYFDWNQDGQVDEAELQESIITESLLLPDIDSECEWLADGLSVGLGFQAVSAQLL